MVRNVIVTTPTIAAIDLGKFNSIFCLFDVATKATTFRTVPTSPELVHAALLRQPDVTVVMEACSPADSGRGTVGCRSGGWWSNTGLGR